MNAVLSLALVFFTGQAGLQAESGRPLLLSMSSAVQVGTANYFALRALRNREVALQGAITEKWRAYLPAVGVSYDRTRNINVGSTDTINHDVRLTIQQVLFDGGRRSLDLDIAKIDRMLAADDFRVTFNGIRLEIQKAYLRVLSARTKVILHSKSLERARNQLKDARREETLGFNTRIQVLTVASRLREIELAYRRAVHEERQALLDLKILLNLQVDTPVELAGDIHRDFLLRRPMVAMQVLIDHALRARPEVQRLSTNVHKLRKENALVEDSWIPRLSVDGYAGRSGPVFPVRQENWGVSLRLSFPIGSATSDSSAGFSQSEGENRRTGSTATSVALFDDLGYDRRVLESKIALGQGMDELRQLPNRIALEVRKSIDTLEDAWDAIRLGNGRAYFQYEGLRLTIARYRVGETRRSDILFQETELVQAQAELVDAIVQYMVAAYALEDAAGLEPGALGLFAERSGAGNTLLPFLISGDYRSIQQKLEQLEKSDPLWQIDELEKRPRVDDQNEKFLIDEVPKE